MTTDKWKEYRYKMDSRLKAYMNIQEVKEHALRQEVQIDQSKQTFWISEQLNKLQTVLFRTAQELITNKKIGRQTENKRLDAYPVTKIQEFRLTHQLVKIIGLAKEIVKNNNQSSNYEKMKRRIENLNAKNQLGIPK